MVVGDLIGSGASQEQAIVGETPNLAARLQGVAEPNSVVIAESTLKLVGNRFELEDLGPKELKGIAGRVRAWAALRPASVDSRFEAFHASGLTELVGREEELELLLRRWSKAKTGEGQVVLLSGEPGIGKSRLTAALLDGGCSAQARSGTAIGARPAHCGWLVVPAGRTTACHLSVQARTCTGRSVWNLLREPRRALHARIADTLESQFAETAENQPEVLARHCTEAGLIEKAAGLWGKAGRRSTARSALAEAVEQLKRALAQIATLPATPALRSEEVNFKPR